MKTAKILANLAVIVIAMWVLLTHHDKIQASISGRDSIAYWATGKRLIDHQNPYSSEDVLALEKSAGYKAEKPMMLRPPPWSLWMVLPLGFLGAYGAWVLWIAVLITSLVLAMRMLWYIYGDESHPNASFLIAGYLFAPVAACLVAGQMGIALLLGITLFLLLEEKHTFYAGIVLIIPFVKPHIFSLVWPVLGIWIITRKRWSLLGGFASAFVITNLIALACDPAIFQHYHQMIDQEGIQKQFIPALSGVIRLVFFRRVFWVQFVPLGLGLLWAGRYYWVNRQQWNWRQHGPALLVISALTTPYSWISDEVVVLPAVLQGVMWISGTRLKLRSKVALIIFGLLDLLILLIIRAEVRPDTGIYFWTSLLWFSWYWYARTFRRSDQSVPQPSAHFVQV